MMAPILSTLVKPLSTFLASLSCSKPTPTSLDSKSLLLQLILFGNKWPPYLAHCSKLLPVPHYSGTGSISQPLACTPITS